MIQQIIESIEYLIQAIYDIDQKDMQEKYLAFLTNIEQFIKKMAELGYQVDLNEDLIKIENAMKKKDYILLADILLYTVKVDFENFEIENLTI